MRWQVQSPSINQDDIDIDNLKVGLCPCLHVNTGIHVYRVCTFEHIVRSIVYIYFSLLGQQRQSFNGFSLVSSNHKGPGRRNSLPLSTSSLGMQLELTVALEFLLAYLYNKLPRR